MGPARFELATYKHPAHKQNVPRSLGVTKPCKRVRQKSITIDFLRHNRARPRALLSLRKT